MSTSIIDQVLRQSPPNITEEDVRRICSILGNTATVADILCTIYNLPTPPVTLKNDEWRQRNDFMDDLYADIQNAIDKKDLKKQ